MLELSQYAAGRADYWGNAPFNSEAPEDWQRGWLDAMEIDAELAEDEHA